MIETFQRIWKISSRRHRQLRKALLLSFLRSWIGVTQILSIAAAVRVMTGATAPKTGLLLVAVLGAVCVAGSFLTSYGEQTGGMEAGFFMVGDQRVAVGNLMRRFPLGYFNDTSAGRIAATLTTTLSGVESAAVMVMVSVISGLFSALAMFVFMLFFDWRIGLITGAGIVAYLLLVSFQMKLSRKNAPQRQRAQSALAAGAVSFLQGIKVTKAFRIRRGDQQLRDAISESCHANITLTNKSMPTQFAAGICIAVFESLILLTSVYLCLGQGNGDLLKTVVLILFSFMVYGSLNQAGSMLSMIGLLDAGLAEIETLEQTEQLKQELPAQKPASSEIVMDHVSFAYGEQEVLHDISVTIPPRALTALIGPSGSGKTTLCQLLARFRDVSSGSITIGGADLRKIPEKDLMEMVSMVFQRVYLFEDTILNNIRFGKPEATLQEVRAAARAACCDDFIMALPDGYDTVLQEGGISLSGGEKQRISIARAMLKDAPIIILDEATSALDAENEHEILQALDALTKNKTVIMIAHRIKTVEKADQILALENGRIVQQGTHGQLRNEPGLYADFLASRKEAAGWQLRT